MTMETGMWMVFLKDIMNKKHHSFSKGVKDKQKDVPNTTISPTKKKFSDFY
jgi:hypothetical protein